MRVIDLKDINLDKCILLKEVNGDFNWKLYHDEKNVYKIFGKNDDEFLKNILKRIQLLNDLNIDEVITPKEVIVDKGKFIGYQAHYVNGSYNMSQFQGKNDLRCFWYLLYKSSMTLRKIHNSSKGIIISDLRLENIIFSKKLIPYFIDLDECYVNGILANSVADSLYEYYKKRGHAVDFISHNTDRLCLILSTLYTIFNKEVDNISTDEYVKLSYKYRTLKNMFPIFLKIKGEDIIDEVPYIDRFISPQDIKKKQI